MAPTTQAEREQDRRDIASLMRKFPMSSRSPLIRRELCDMLTAAYLARVLERDEWRALMADVV